MKPISFENSQIKKMTLFLSKQTDKINKFCFKMANLTSLLYNRFKKLINWLKKQTLLYKCHKFVTFWEKCSFCKVVKLEKCRNEVYRSARVFFFLKKAAVLAEKVTNLKQKVLFYKRNYNSVTTLKRKDKEVILIIVEKFFSNLQVHEIYLNYIKKFRFYKHIFFIVFVLFWVFMEKKSSIL